MSEYVPSERWLAEILTVPDAHGLVRLMVVEPSYSATSSPLVQLTVNVGVGSFVMLSVEEEPVSELASRSGVPEAPGALHPVVLQTGLSGSALHQPSEQHPVGPPVAGWLSSTQHTAN